MDLSINWIMFGDIQAFDKYLTVIITQNSYNLALPWVFMPSDVLFLLVSNRALWHPIWYPHTAYSRTCAKAKLIHGSAHLSKILCFSPPLAIITTHHLGLSCINICKVPVLPFLIIVSCLVWDCVANVVPRTIWESWGFEFEILVKILLSFFSSFSFPPPFCSCCFRIWKGTRNQNLWCIFTPTLLQGQFPVPKKYEDARMYVFFFF